MMMMMVIIMLWNQVMVSRSNITITKIKEKICVLTGAVNTSRAKRHAKESGNEQKYVG